MARRKRMGLHGLGMVSADHASKARELLSEAKDKVGGLKSMAEESGVSGDYHGCAIAYGKMVNAEMLLSEAHAHLESMDKGRTRTDLTRKWSALNGKNIDSYHAVRDYCLVNGPMDRKSKKRTGRGHK